MPPCDCLDDKVKKILYAIREMDSREFEAMLRRSEREGKTVDELIEETLSKKSAKKGSL